MDNAHKWINSDVFASESVDSARIEKIGAAGNMNDSAITPGFLRMRLVTITLRSLIYDARRKNPCIKLFIFFDRYRTKRE